MDIQAWIDKRKNPNSLDGIALRMWLSGKQYSELEQKLRQRYLLEALIANGGHQGKTAQQLGIGRGVITRAVKMMGLTDKEIRSIASTVKEPQ